MIMRRLWIAFVLVIVASFAVLGWAGVRMYQQSPPIPETVVTADGRLVIAQGDIAAGQDVWRSLGGMEMGSIWGHGSALALFVAGLSIGFSYRKEPAPSGELAPARR
jgi:nitric oxide reductase subunit B